MIIYNRKEKITGIPTGFSDLDERTAGLQPSDLIIIAGRPSMGKTSLALGMALNAALNRAHPYTVAIFSLEMSKEQLCMRLLSAAGSLNMHRIRTGHLNEDEWKTLARTASLLHESRIYIDDTPAITVLEMGAKIRRLRAEHGLDLVVVDYLQLMSGGGNSETVTGYFPYLSIIEDRVQGLKIPVGHYPNSAVRLRIGHPNDPCSPTSANPAQLSRMRIS